MQTKNNIENQIRLIQGENVNAAKCSDGKDFFTLLGGILSLMLIFFIVFDHCSSFFIGCISPKTQMKIESFFKGAIDSKLIVNDDKYNSQLDFLIETKEIIKSLDKKIQNRSNLDIFVIKNEQINAMIAPDGSIYFTTALLDENFDEEMLAFVLAHELGHYSHKDHLRSISKKVSIIILSLLLNQDSNISSIVSSVTDSEFLVHSRNQERAADKYASKMMNSIYGSNDGGKRFFIFLEEKESIPEFLHYFSTHPASKERYRLLDSY